MLDHRLAVFPYIFVKNVIQSRMNRALAAVIHDDHVERFVEFVKDDFVVVHKRI